jgi:pimeloyl-ACP methyl ester carboxylesterase
LKDKALLPVQLDNLNVLVPDLRIVIEKDAGHFIPWEKPEVVTGAIRDFMAETAEA